MKTYEEMARDVLRRRDEELSNITQASQLQSQINPPPEVVYPAAPKKRGKLGLLPKIAIPCAAAVLVGTVGVSVWKNVRGRQSPNQMQGIAAEYDSNNTPNNTPAADENGDVLQLAHEDRESIYKGGKTEICINEVEDWDIYNIPVLLGEDFCPLDDDMINTYYGFEFDRLSRVFPEWESEHDPFGTYAHDEDDGFAASHRIIYTTNVIHYTNKASLVAVAASITPRYDSATVENAKPSVINGFDAMVYSRIGELDEMQYAADIEMGIAQVQIHAVNVSKEEFLNILDVYTAPDKDSEDNQNNNQNQTMEDKIVVYNGLPDFIGGVPPYEPVYTDYSDTEGVTWRWYSEEELNALYGLNFMCFSELHPDWKKFYDELSFGVYYNVDDHAIGGDIPQNREIVGTRNYVAYSTSEGNAVTIIASKRELPETDIEHSVVNGYDAILFLGFEDGKYRYYSAFIDMDDTLLCITVTGFLSENDFLDIIREYTSEASKYDKSANPPEPSEFESFSAVDFVDDKITYEVSWDAQSSWWKLNYSEDFDAADKYGKIEYSDTTLVYLRDFFGTNKLPVDYRYQNNFEREMYDGTFYCNTAEGAMAYSPVDGKVVGACEGWYNRGLGNAVAVEFGDGKIFIIGHLDEVNVEVGDTVAAGQVLGVCGQSGLVYFGDPPKLSLIMMVKTDD